MEKIYINSTLDAPEIDFDPVLGVLKISGESYPENAMKLYNPLFAWLKEYFLERTELTTLHILLSYVNTSSSKCLMTLLEIMETAHVEGRPVWIQWHVDPENEIELECAEEFKLDFTMPFDIIEV